MKVFDTTGLTLTGLDSKQDSTASWQLGIISGKGGLTLTVSAIDLSDVLSDGGIQEAGDVATRAVRPSLWKASKLLRNWTEGGLVDEMSVNEGRPGGPEAILDITSIVRDDRYLRWTVNLSSSMCLEIWRLAAAAVGYPWFSEVQENVGRLDIVDQEPW